MDPVVKPRGDTVGFTDLRRQYPLVMTIFILP
ncbi:MAG TPA: hypothetical protein LFW20_04105 [Rickettsia endosymbiont of Omalisus fontisbellaquei]|nr:hypothetical protein [Rickettsia endosymbiont of Omalisus fontisbellaquei]